MTTTMSINEAREKLGTLAGLPVTTIEAAKILAALGITVTPEKLEPGTWHLTRTEGWPAFIGDGGDLIVVEPSGVLDFYYADHDDWPDLDPATPPARVVPAEPVELSHDEVDAIWEEVDGHAPAPIGVRGTMNIALKEHGHGRALPDSKQVSDAIASGFSLAEQTDAVMALLGGGDRG